MNKTELEKRVEALEAENAQLRESADAVVVAENTTLREAYEALKTENDQYVNSLKEAHSAIDDAEAQVVDAPVFTANAEDEDGKKSKVKVKLIIAKSFFPKGRNNKVEITADVLKDDQGLVDELYSIGFGGFEEINPKD